jgi:hypothetical protein
MSAGPRRPGDVLRLVRIALLLLGCAVASPAGAQQQPAPEATAEQQAADAKKEQPPKRRGQRLVLDIDKHVERKLEEEARIAPPRFQESIEVVGRSPQMLLERFFGGVDLECGPAVGGGAPTIEEMRGYRPHTSPTADLMALAMALAGKVMGKVKGKPEPLYYLYAVRRSSAVNYALREDRVPDSWFYNFPGVTFELVASFPDRDSAVTAWRRMERGYGTPAAPKVEAIPQWATAPCRPRR